MPLLLLQHLVSKWVLNRFLWVCSSSARITESQVKTHVNGSASPRRSLLLALSFGEVSPVFMIFFATRSFPPVAGVTWRDASPPPHCVVTTVCTATVINPARRSFDPSLPWVGVSTLPQSPWATQHWFQTFSNCCASATGMKTMHGASLLLSSLTLDSLERLKLLIVVVLNNEVVILSTSTVTLLLLLYPLLCGDF